jgi:hypothetical protein
MSRNTTGTGNNLEGRVKDAIRDLYKPSAREIKAKATFHYRIKNGAYKGTPESEWTVLFIQEVLGTNIKLGTDALAWFKNTESYEESKAAGVLGAMDVINEIMHDPENRAGDRLKAAELALKIDGVFDKEKDSGSKADADSFSDAEKEALKAQGVNVDAVIKQVR